jgi:hypothetical protein
MKTNLVKTICIGIAILLCGCGTSLSEETASITTATAATTSTAAATAATTTTTTTTAATTAAVATTAATINTELYLDYPTERYSSEYNDLPYRINPGLLRYSDVAVNELFKAITTNDSEYLALLTNAYSFDYDPFEFIKDIKFDGFTIVSSEYLEEPHFSLSEHADKSYVVTVKVIESNDERFPVGENTFEISCNSVADEKFSSFYRVGDEKKETIWHGFGNETVSDNVRYCYFLTTEMHSNFPDEFTDEFIIPDESEETKAGFHRELLRFLWHVLPADVPVATPEILNTYAKQFFGFESEFNDENYDSTFYGANVTDAVLVSENENSVTIDYYADSLLLVKAYTIKYNFDTKDGFRFISIEKLYDSGFDPSRYTT